MSVLTRAVLSFESKEEYQRGMGKKRHRKDLEMAPHGRKVVREAGKKEREGGRASVW